MATTTTNYGFDVPTSSDLVKNGATAISTLGQDLDTFLFRPFTRNAVINGGMDIWQRGTSSASQGYVTADRWYMTGASTTFSQETSDLPTGFRYALKCTMSGTAQPQPILTIETQDSIRFAGQTVVLSYYVKTSNSTNAVIRLDSSNNVDESVTGTYSTIATNSAATTTSWTRVSSTFAAPSTSKTLRVVVGANGNLTSGQTILIAGVQLETGTQATPFIRAGGTIQGELAACQRYYYRTTGQAAAANDLVSGWANSTTSAVGILRFPNTMRVAPTCTGSAAGDFLFSWSAGISTISAFAIDRSSPDSINLRLTTSGLTTGQGGYLALYSGTTKWLEASAEL